MSDTNVDSSAPAAAIGSLRVRDAVSIIVGIVVGTAIFKAPTMVFQNVSGPWQALGVWLAGGVLSLIGAFCYAELATTYPRSGGDYHYLSRAYGRWMGFLFGWAQLAVIFTGSIGAMAYAFADYAARLFQITADWVPWLAIAVILVLSVMNLLGVIVGRTVQNVLTAAKILGLAGIVLAGLFLVSGHGLGTATTSHGTSLGLAMVFVLYAYGGWNDAAFVAAEVKDRRRDIPRALFLGIGLITAIYLLVILAYLIVLGYETASENSTPAAEVLYRALGPWGGKLASLLVMISALGAINGLILTGSRVYASLGADHRLFNWLSGWSQRGGSPWAALTAQCAIAMLLVAAVGTAAGQATIDFAVRQIGVEGLPWERYFGGFETLVAGTAPVFWSFFMLTGLSLFWLRWRDPQIERPFPAPLYPISPIIFCGMCAYMLYSSLDYARALSVIGLLPLAIGIPLYFWSGWLGRR
jgi:APA family basic amino acid/polyamine antiporter